MKKRVVNIRTNLGKKYLDDKYIIILITVKQNNTWSIK